MRGLPCLEETLSLSPSKGEDVPGKPLLSRMQYGVHLWNFQILFGCFKLLPGSCCCLSLDKFVAFSGPHFAHLYGCDNLTDETQRCHFLSVCCWRHGDRGSFTCILSFISHDVPLRCRGCYSYLTGSNRLSVRSSNLPKVLKPGFRLWSKARVPSCCSTFPLTRCRSVRTKRNDDYKRIL